MAAEEEPRISITVLVGLGGAQEDLELPVSATVADLRTALEAQVATGGLAYRLVTEAGGELADRDARLQDLGLGDGSSVTMVKLAGWDYSKITAFERVVSCPRYPNGVLVDDDGRIISCHFWGSITVFSEKGNGWQAYEPTGRGFRTPGQMAWGKPGEIVVAYRGSNQIGVLDAVRLTVIRELASGIGHAGVAVSGDRVFVSADRCIRVLDYDSGKVLQELSREGDFDPSGLAMMDDDRVVVADRRNHRVRIFSVSAGKEILELPLPGSKETLSKPNDVVVDSAGQLLVMDTGNERIAVFREDGTFVASVMPGFFKDHGNTFSYLACSHSTGQIVVSNNDEHKIAVLAPIAALSA